MRLGLRLVCGIGLLVASTACSREPGAPSYAPGLGEIMTLTQMRHVKLWFAGTAGNWALAEYEFEEMHEGLEDAATFHPTHKDATLPIPELIEKITNDPLDELEQAIRARSDADFTRAFDAVTESCNACHRATKFDFNVVTRPAANPYTNQVFAPAP